MSGYWKTPAGVDVPEQTPFDAVGDYIWRPANYVTNTEYSFGARGAVAGDGGTIQLWGELAGKRVNIGAATAVTFAAPIVWPTTFFKDGKVGITLSALTGAVVVETSP
jgi:hypothetical protein